MRKTTWMEMRTRLLKTTNQNDDNLPSPSKIIRLQDAYCIVDTHRILHYVVTTKETELQFKYSIEATAVFSSRSKDRVLYHKRNS